MVIVMTQQNQYPNPAAPQVFQPQPQAQGYPGPAVNAPQVEPPPAQQTPAQAPYPAPQAPYQAPQGAPQAPYQAPPQPAPPPYQALPQAAPHYGHLGPSIWNATNGNRPPVPGPGNYVLRLEKIGFAARSATLIADLTVVESNNPAHPQGSPVSYVEGIQYGEGRIRDFLLAAGGFASQDVFAQYYQAQGQDPAQAFAAFYQNAINGALNGRTVAAIVAQQTRVPRQGKNAGQQVTYTEWRWSPTG